MKIQVPTLESIQENKRKRLLNLVENACKQFEFNLEEVVERKRSTILEAPSTITIQSMGFGFDPDLAKEVLRELYLKEDQFVTEFNNTWQGKFQIIKIKNAYRRFMFQVTNLEKENK